MADQLAKSEIITKQLEGRGSFFIKPEAESIADKIIKLMEDKETQTRKLNNSLIKKFNISGPDIVKNKSSVKKAIESNYLLTLKQQLIKDMDVDIKEATTKLRSYLYSLTSKQQEILLSEIKSFKRTKIIRDVLNPKGLESVVSTKQALANLEEKAGERAVWAKIGIRYIGNENGRPRRTGRSFSRTVQ